MKTMADAGYTFDFEKKELKKNNSYCQENCKGYQQTGKCFADGDCKDKTEAEQKHVVRAEPKFHVGDFIADYYCRGKIVKITDDSYLLDTGQGIPFSCEHNTHLYTIQDAKNGDVIATDNYIFIFKNIDDDGGVHYYCHYEIFKHEDDGQFGISAHDSIMGRTFSTQYSPATKEQRDTIMKAMTDAGYTFDFEKKELKKIEQKPDRKSVV